MFSGMIIILLVWAVSAVAFTGVGLAVQRVLRFPVLRIDGLLDAFWVGWGTVLCGLQLWHLLAPVNAAAFWVFAGLGALGFAGNVRTGLRESRSDGSVKWAAPCVLVLAVWLANRALGPLTDYDAGLYHLSAVRWIGTFPIVPGLGNLHGRLAFSNGHFLQVAMMGACTPAVAAHGLCNGLVLLALVARMTLGVVRTVLPGTGAGSDDVMSAVLVPGAAGLAFVHGSSLSADLTIFAVGVVVSLWVCRMVFRVSGPGEDASALFRITLLSAVGVTLKLSFAVWGLCCVLVAGAWLVRESGIRRALQHGVPAVAAALLVLVPFAARGVIMTGYPVYPSTFGAFDVEWRKPECVTVDMMNVIKAWARNPGVRPGRVLGNREWVGPWLRRTARRRDVVLPLAVAAAGLLAALVRARALRKELLPALALVLPPALFLVYWAFTAPDPRFAGAAFWCLAAGVVAAASNPLFTLGTT